MWSVPLRTDDSELPKPLRDRVERLVLEQATRSERVLSWGRAGFCLLVLLRFLLLGGGDKPAAWVTVPAVVVALAFSGYLLRRRGAFTARLLSLSVIVDATTCFAALLPNVLWPWAAYRGLLATPDVVALVLIVCVSGLRLRPEATRLSIASNAASAALLVGLDAQLNAARAPVDVNHLTLCVLWLFFASWIATTHARRGLDLAARSAVESLRGGFAVQNLRALLAGHHDARTLLSSVTLNAELLAKHLAPRGDAEAQDLAGAVCRDLAELHGFERSIKEHAWGAFVSQGTPLPAQPSAAFATAAGSVRALFPNVRLSLVDTADRDVLAVGGSGGLERALLNLLVNACEGSGERGASTVVVQVDVTGDAVVVAVEDDGPGFPLGRLTGPLDRPHTTKEAGSGLGLLLVRNFAEASGGGLTLANAPAGGARVELSLRAATDRLSSP